MPISHACIKSLVLDELKTALATQGLKPYRAAQVFDWIYKHGATTFDEMTNLSKAERTLLASSYSLVSPRILEQEASADGTEKYLLQLEDRQTIESVVIPDGKRLTLCISTQVGCKQGCRFCLTGRNGFRRNLTAYEIADQVAVVEKNISESGDGPAGEARPDRRRHITNIVLMGMGEPLANYEAVQRALTIITAAWGFGFSPRRVTLSTVGLVPEIKKLGRDGPRVNIAVSLNATTDRIRDGIMPVNKRFPLQELIAACRHYPLEPTRRITFEYVLLGGVNDSEEDALRLATLLRGIPCKVNLIPFNPFPGSAFSRPEDGAVSAFQKVLRAHNFTALVRESRGKDISAACGQLRSRQALLQSPK